MCPYEGCTKFFGSEGSQNLHIKIKHNGGSKTDREKLAKTLIHAYANNTISNEIIEQAGAEQCQAHEKLCLINLFK